MGGREGKRARWGELIDENFRLMKKLSDFTLVFAYNVILGCYL